VRKPKAPDPRIEIVARAIAAVNYPNIAPAELNRPAQRWDGTKLTDAACSIWEDHIPEAEAAIAALAEALYLR
jgi:hypothetical protein